MTGNESQGSGPDPAEIAALEEQVARLSAENEHLRHESPTLVLDRPTASRRRWRWTAAIALLVIAALLTPAALVGFWGQRTIVDAERYLATVEPLAQNQAIRDAVATKVSDELIARVDIDAYVKEYLPPQASALAPAISGAVTNFLESSIEKFMASDQFDQLWIDVNKLAQQELLRALNGDTTGAVQIQNGTVTLDLSIVIESVRQRLVDRGLTIFANVTIPANTGRTITLLTSTQLATAENVWTYTEPIARWLLPVVVLLFLGAIFLAPNRRRMLLIAGLAVFAGMALLAVALAFARSRIIDAAGQANLGPAIEAFYDTMLRYLYGSLGALAVLGLTLAFLAWLSGPSTPAAGLRRLESRATNSLGETAGRWHPLAAIGRVCGQFRAALRGVVLTAVIVGFFINGVANWKSVLVAVGVGALLWLLLDTLSAAAVHAQDRDEPPPPADTDAPLPVDA